MACFSPVTGYRSRTVNKESGKRSVVFNSRYGYVDLPVTLKCGQCIGCRLDRSLEIAIRIQHEIAWYEEQLAESCFITLTYDPEHLPPYGSLVKSHYQKFHKRLAKAYGRPIRKFAVGEYGEKLQRPHYHAILFGFKPDDLRPAGRHNGVQYYGSERLAKIWGKGFVAIGDANFDTAAYCARYVTKKISGENAHDHYVGADPYTGEVQPIEREFALWSRSPFIGERWFEKYGEQDIYNQGGVVTLNGKQYAAPKIYDERFGLDKPEVISELKKARKAHIRNSEDATPERLAVRETCKILQFKKLKRPIEE